MGGKRGRSASYASPRYAKLSRPAAQNSQAVGRAAGSNVQSNPLNVNTAPITDRGSYFLPFFILGRERLILGRIM